MKWPVLPFLRVWLYSTGHLYLGTFPALSQDWTFFLVACFYVFPRLTLKHFVWICFNSINLHHWLALFCVAGCVLWLAFLCLLLGSLETVGIQKTILWPVIPCCVCSHISTMYVNMCDQTVSSFNVAFLLTMHAYFFGLSCGLPYSSYSFPSSS